MIQYELMTGGTDADAANGVRYFGEDELADASERAAEAITAALADKKALAPWVRLTRKPDEVILLDWSKNDKATSIGSDSPLGA